MKLRGTLIVALLSGSVAASYRRGEECERLEDAKQVEEDVQLEGCAAIMNPAPSTPLSSCRAMFYRMMLTAKRE